MIALFKQSFALTLSGEVVWANRKTNSRAAKIFSFLGNGEKIVCEMKVSFTIADIQCTIGLQLYLLKRSIDKVTESGFQAINVSGDVEKRVTVFRKVCQSLKILYLIHSKEH